MPQACRELRVLMRSGDDWKNAQHTFRGVRAVRQEGLHQIPGHVQIAQFGAAAGGAPVGPDWRQIGGSARVLSARARHSASDCRSASPEADLRSSTGWTGLLETTGRWPGVLVEAASSGGTGTGAWPPARYRPGRDHPPMARDRFAASSPALAFSGRITPKMRPQDRDDTDDALCLQLRRRYV